jgi:hypothetical protein
MKKDRSDGGRRQKRHSEECLFWNARAADPDHVQWALAGGSQWHPFSTPYSLIKFKEAVVPGGPSGREGLGLMGPIYNGRQASGIQRHRSMKESVPP